MRKKIKTGLMVIIGLCCLSVVGCQNVQNLFQDEAKLNRVAGIMELASQVAAEQAVAQKPYLKAPLLIVADVLDAAVAAETLEPSAIRSTIQIELDAAGYSAYASIVDLTLSLLVDQYADYYAANIRQKADAYPALITLLESVRDGIRKGTGNLVGSSGESRTPEEILQDLPEDLRL